VKVTFHNLTEKLVGSLQQAVANGNICELISAINSTLDASRLSFDLRFKSTSNFTDRKAKALFLQFVYTLCQIETYGLNFSANMDAIFMKERNRADDLGAKESGLNSHKLTGTAMDGDTITLLQKRLQQSKSRPIFINNQSLQNTSKSSILFVPFRCKGSHCCVLIILTLFFCS
jgi:hypothetical protein